MRAKDRSVPKCVFPYRAYISYNSLQDHMGPVTGFK